MLEHMLSTHAHTCLVPVVFLLNTIWKQFLQQLLQAILGNGKDNRSLRAKLNADALTSDMYYNLFKDLFLQSPLGLQPLSIILGQHLTTQFRQVQVRHLIQLKPFFQAIVHHHAHCVIQLKTMHGSLTQLSNEHTILLGSGKDMQIIMKVGVHRMKVAEMLRFTQKERRWYKI